MSTMFYWTARIRDEFPREPGEGFDAWLDRTEAIAVQAVERDQKREVNKQETKQVGANIRLAKRKEKYNR